MTEPITHHTARAVATACCTVVVLAILTLAGVACYQWGRATASNEASELSITVNGCRASYRADLLDLPTTRALRAIQLGDEDELASAVTDAKVERYQELIDLSQEDVPGFLEQCDRDGNAG